MRLKAVRRDDDNVFFFSRSRLQKIKLFFYFFGSVFRQQIEMKLFYERVDGFVVGE